MRLDSAPGGRFLRQRRQLRKAGEDDLALQFDALMRCGVAKELTFTDQASGAKYQRPGLDTCLEQLQGGDILLVWQLDR